MTVLVRNSAAALAGMSWDALLGHRDGLLAADSLRHAEQQLTHRPAYLVATGDGHRAEAGLACYLIRASEHVLHQARLDLALLPRLSAAGVPEPAGRRLLADLMPTLSVGARQIGYSRMALGPNGAAGCLPDLLASAAALARSVGARSVSLPWVAAGDVNLRAALRSAGYAELPGDAGAGLAVPPGDFEAYLAGLPGRRRRSVRNERRSIARSGVSVRVADGLPAGDVDRFATLNAEHLLHYGQAVPPAQLVRSLHGLSARLGERLVRVTAERAGPPIAFVLALRWRDELYPLIYGCDYAAKGTLPLYFELGYYRLVEYAQAHGHRWIDYGCGALELKLSRGCRPLPTSAYVLCLDPGAQRELLAAARSLAGAARASDLLATAGAAPASETGDRP